MAKFWVTEKSTIGEVTDDWQDRVENLVGAEILQWGNKKLKVEVDDEINLRMAVGDVCRIERV